MNGNDLRSRWRVRLYSVAPAPLQRGLVRLFMPTYPIAVSVVVVNDGGGVLLLRHTYGEPMWRLPGGLVERGEEVYDAAVREVAEEASCDIKPVAIADAAATPSSFDVAVAARLVQLHPFQGNAETCARQWLNLAELNDLPDLQKRFIKAAIQLT